MGSSGLPLDDLSKQGVIWSYLHLQKTIDLYTAEDWRQKEMKARDQFEVPAML